MNFLLAVALQIIRKKMSKQFRLLLYSIWNGIPEQIPGFSCTTAFLNNGLRLFSGSCGMEEN